MLIKNLRCWSLDGEYIIMTMTVVLKKHTDISLVQDTIRTYLIEQHHIDEITIEIEL